jgi:lipoprotein-releasing system permease protein
MRLEKKLFGGAICLIILVAAFNIISSLIMVVIEKTREIGILRAMGVSSQSIMRIFVMVGGFVGFFGTLFGTVFGVLICLAQQEWGFIKLPPDVYMISVFPVEVLWSDIIMVFVVGNILTLGVTILPARKAAKHNPLEAIRHE